LWYAFGVLIDNQGIKDLRSLSFLVPTLERGNETKNFQGLIINSDRNKMNKIVW
jgi:hypothetical protein